MSYIIVERSTGKAVAELYSKSLVNKINKDKYKALPVRKYLESLNKVKPAT